jgi:hypothetical protein
MRQRVRKLVGSIALVAFICFYALLAMAIAAAKLSGASHLVQLAYFLIAGLVWVIPAAALVSWMQKPDRPRS